MEICRSALEFREKGRFKGNNFYAYGRPQNHDLLLSEKILVPVIVNHAKAMWDSVGLHVIDSVYVVKRMRHSDISEKYVLGILNSHLLTYFLMKTSSNLRGGYFSMKPGYVNPFPLKVDFSKEEQGIYEQIIQNVDRIIQLSGNLKLEINRKEIEVLKERTDDLIYSIYGLTEEKQVIENVVNKNK